MKSLKEALTCLYEHQVVKHNLCRYATSYLFNTSRSRQSARKQQEICYTQITQKQKVLSQPQLPPGGFKSPQRSTEFSHLEAKNGDKTSEINGKTSLTS